MAHKPCITARCLMLHECDVQNSTQAIATKPSSHAPDIGDHMQWCSQDEQVTCMAQHGHTHCMRNTHLLGDLGHTPAIFGHKYHSAYLPVISLHACMKHAIAHANN